MNPMNTWLGRLAHWLGCRRAISVSGLPWDVSAADQAIITRCLPYSMTGVLRLAALVSAVRHVVRAPVPGALVECGVWRGGSAMAAAWTLLEEEDTTRDLFLYDTFTGMTLPTALDVRYDGTPAAEELARTPRGAGIWCVSSLDEVRANLAGTQYPRDRLHFIAGRVEETVPETAPETIALLRLDTDWYESTRHELEHLYPRLSPGGILIIDDYGYWQGARRAVDEYFARQPKSVYLHRIDETARLVVKP